MVYLVLKIIPPAAGREKGVTALFSHEEIQSLNTLEMSVYNYVSKNREKVIYMKIRELAAQAHVSTPRCCTCAKSSAARAIPSSNCC